MKAGGRPRSAILGLVALVAASLACSFPQHSASISVTPRQACSGDAVTLEWSATTDGPYRIASTLDGYDPSSLGRDGSDTVTVDRTAHVRDTDTIHFTFRGGDLSDHAAVTLVPTNGSDLELELEPDCGPRCGPPRWSTTLTEAEWSPRIEIASVTNPNDRTITASFAGITRTLTAGESATDWSGNSMIGHWTLKAALRSATPPDAMHFESCCEHVGRAFNPITATHRPPPVLTLVVHHRCPE